MYAVIPQLGVVLMACGGMIYLPRHRALLSISIMELALIIDMERALPLIF